MSTQTKTAISPTRQEDYPEWYQQVIKASDMAENSPVRGCMIIKPWGYALWENMVQTLDTMFKEIGIKNAYFPLFIPLEFFQKEAEHVEGFAKECAVVTHHKLEVSENGTLVPSGQLAEPLIVRPTSETIIGDAFSRWVSSYRDLPIRINQWANVVRWEMRTRIFLRTTEFLWQEGHTAHASEQEAVKLAYHMLNVYANFVENYMAIPVIKGQKTPTERFPGAEETLCIEAMMQDRKALQAGTSHFLGQNFAKASNIQFQDAQGDQVYAWTTSWGVSTRLIGGLIMTHGDDNGIIMPPRLSPAHVVLLPIFRKPDEKTKVMSYIEQLSKELRSISYYGRPISVEIDEREIGGARGWDWIKKGTPLRVEIGPRDIANDSVFVGRRDKEPNEKVSFKREVFVKTITEVLDDIQRNLYERALSHRQSHTISIQDKKTFYDYFTPANTTKPEIHGGFAYSHWCGQAECERQIKEELTVTIRCIPLSVPKSQGTCIYCGKPSSYEVYFAKAY
ncbi:MAG: proline--tRNA ligase [Desulfobacterales bacterium]|nr:proline--tRNA ligase [Desulfobacterales bacterium]